MASRSTMGSSQQSNQRHTASQHRTSSRDRAYEGRPVSEAPRRRRDPSPSPSPERPTSRKDKETTKGKGGNLKFIVSEDRASLSQVNLITARIRMVRGDESGSEGEAPYRRRRAGTPPLDDDEQLRRVRRDDGRRGREPEPPRGAEPSPLAAVMAGLSGVLNPLMLQQQPPPTSMGSHSRGSPTGA